ncbi:hypothetical protein [Streptosporangium sp. NPDC049376]|uniref:hypothetical protein n=1 Tax=Streptosporangium sp. NPDC049376 TaxID=3366192 RepID=UPI00379725FC
MRDHQRWKVRLVELAWELGELGLDATVRLPRGRRASLEIFVPSRSRGMALCRGRVSVFAWRRRDNQAPQVVDHIRAALGKIGKGVTP